MTFEMVTNFPIIFFLLDRVGERRGIYRVLVGKREGKTPVGRPRLRWEDNIKMDLQKWNVGA
jgi:hypothetical protein